MGPKVFTSIEIAASPEVVRRVFLDLARHKEWTKRWTIDIPKHGSELKAGDKIKVDIGGMAFSPVILENTEKEFTWKGSIPLLFHGTHKFLFLPSKDVTGNTTLEQSEIFGGVLASVFGGGSDSKTSAGFQLFNKDLKAEAEKVAAAEGGDLK